MPPRPAEARRWTRRAILGAGVAAAAATAAGSWALARRRDGNHPAAAAPSPSTTIAPTTGPTTGPTPDQRTRGGEVRLSSPGVFQFDTFDSLRTGETSVAEVLGRTHSRLVQWAHFARGEMAGDLAARWEQPDATTLNLRLDPAARWQERGPLPSRTVTGTDVVAHFRRAAADAKALPLPAAQRPRELASIRRVSTPADGLVVFELETPDPFFLSTLASRYALVQAPEMVDAFAATWTETTPEQVAGSGSFIFEGLTTRGELEFRAFAGAHRTPLVDRLAVRPAGGDEVDAFLRRELDETILRDRRAGPAVAAAAPTTLMLRRFEDSPVISTVFAGSAPWSNAELRLAISGALNRHWLTAALFGGRAEAAGPVAPAFGAATLDQATLARFPGYASDAASDAADARRRWDAAGGSGLGTVTIDFPSIFDPRYSASSVIVERLNEVLGPGQFAGAIETYTVIARKVGEGRYGNGTAALWFGWGPPLADPDPSRWLVETYGSGSAGAATLGEAPAAVTAAVARLAGEFDEARRRELCKEVARRIVDGGGAGIFDWALQWADVVRGPGMVGPDPSPFWGQHLDAGRWLDRR